MKQIKLTHREESIMDLLRSMPGQVLKRSLIAEKIFNVPFTESNLIDAHVANIRRKLGKNAVESIRGCGYRVPAFK